MQKCILCALSRFEKIAVSYNKIYVSGNKKKDILENILENFNEKTHKYMPKRSEIGSEGKADLYFTFLIKQNRDASY